MPLASKIPTDASVKEIILPCFLCRLHAKDCRFFSMKGNLFSSDIFMKTSVFFVYLQVIKPVVGLVYVVQNKWFISWLVGLYLHRRTQLLHKVYMLLIIFRNWRVSWNWNMFYFHSEIFVEYYTECFFFGKNYTEYLIYRK